MSSSSTKKISFSMCKRVVSNMIAHLDEAEKRTKKENPDIDVWLKIEEIIEWASSPPGKELFAEVGKLSVEQRIYIQLLKENIDLKAEIAELKNLIYKGQKNG